MNKETNSIKWMEELAKADDEVCRCVAKEIEASHSNLRTYNAVLGFVPHRFASKPKNLPVASLLKQYATKGSRRRQEARRLLQQRFEYLDYSVQKKILWLFLDGSQQDRKFCYRQLMYTWDSAFDAKLTELWETFHEPECAMVVVRYCNADYVRKHSEELTKSVGYYQVCKRLCEEDKFYVIDLGRLAGPHEYVRVLYEVHRRVGSDEATRILWRTIESSLLQCICNDCEGKIIANYFITCIRNGETTDWPNEMLSPSVAWRPQVMECMRYLYRIAPRSIVAEAMNWDMKVGRLFHRLTIGMSSHRFDNLSDEDQLLVWAMREMKAFCKLAYAMFPTDKKELLAQDGRNADESESLCALFDYDSCNSSSEISRQRDDTDKKVENLLETIKEYRLSENMTPDEWGTFYKEKINAQSGLYAMLAATQELELVCPSRNEFIEKLLY